MIRGGYINAIGRRKRSVARVRLKAGDGTIVVNDRPYESYFGRESLNRIVRQPLEVAERMENTSVFVAVSGGGLSGQAGAVRHGIARALVGLDNACKPVLKSAGYLTRDAREVERKKFGRHKARKRPQFSKR